MKFLFRQEIKSDHASVNQIIKSAFESLEISDQTEHLLVRRLRNAETFIPELSIVALFANRVVGHILLTPIHIKYEEIRHRSLALAPVSVFPKLQRNGIGSSLIRHSHRIAKDLGFESIILIGHEDYYPRFGYRQAKDFGINFPFEVPTQNGFAIELIPDSLRDVKGMVIYPPSFFE